PNYHPDVTSPLNTVDVLFDLLGDMDTEALKMAVRASCAQPGRIFAPSAGEIRGVMGELQAQASGLPSAAEAWAEVCNMPPDMVSKTIKRDCAGNPVFEVREDGTSAAIILVENHKWSHPLVEKLACDLGWPHFPGENEGVDRAHFIKLYEQQRAQAISDSVRLPAITEYVQRNKQLGDGVWMLTDKLSRGG